MKQFIVDRHTTPSTPSMDEVPNEKIPIYDNLADVESDLANLEAGQIVATKDTGDELSQPVDVVEEGNLHAVSSNAVAESQKWKDLNGNSIVGLDYNELSISAWIFSNGTTNEIVFTQQYARGQLSLTQTPQILMLGGYYISSNDYGLCNLNNNQGVITIRKFYYAGQNYTSSAGIKIRYR